MKRKREGLPATEPAKEDPTIEAYGKLRNHILTAKENSEKNLRVVKDTIEQRKKELEQLEISKRKLEGAIEMSAQYLKAALPSNK